MLDQQKILEALKAVKYPGYSRDIVSFGLVKEAAVNEDAVSVTLQLTSPGPQVAQQLKEECERTLRSLPGVRLVHVQVNAPAPAPQAAGQPNPWAQQSRVPGI